MITVKAPLVYWNEPDVLKRSGEKVASLGQHALIITGKAALQVVRDDLLNALEQAGVSYKIQLFQGQCTSSEIITFVQTAKQAKVDLIIGIDGGKTLDLSKAVAEKAGLPIVTVPTIAATCAAWSALTVLYDDNGRAAGYLPLLRSPDLVLADTHILATAPRRYLAAGIGDTLVKWHEFAVNLSGNAQSLALRSSVATAQLALDILEEHAQAVYEAAGTDTIPAYIIPAFQDVLDSIIVLAGLVGSVQDGSVHAAIAHGLHDSLTQFPETHHSLHGEKVAFGLFVQWVLEGKSDSELHERALQLHRLGLPVSLSDLGIQSEPEQIASRIAQGLALREGAADHLAFVVTPEPVATAIIRADAIGHTVRQYKHTSNEKVITS
ncbi:iron-containing alcohol dehydrogenase family protein [Paenibacillus sp. BJ-4]|uniref:iron-containing alcohol dehydrogenase family protein n=1 Tax=Paenibacillus sp. BJ-4 TaxID=2878097 RepID=UPI001CF01760|nr:iron-containing alcohol dehydrogenase family protein [Paenibacillus sp. BJ-4]